MDIPFSLFSFAIIASFTPGPNNILVMSQSMNYGLRSTTSYQLGAGVACFVIMLLALALGNIVEKLVPSVVPIMTYVGCAYMLYLAWVVARSKPHDVNSPHKQAHFWLGFGLQFVNPKYYLYVLTLVAVLIPVTHNVTRMLFYAGFFSLLAVVGMLTWAVCGAVLHNFLHTHYKAANLTMAAALVYCSLALFW